MKQLFVGMTIVLATAACSSKEPMLRGKLDLAAVGRTGGSLVAVSDDGITRTAELGSAGDFQIELEQGRAFTFGFEERGRHFADLFFRTGDATKSVVRTNSESDIEVGTVEPVPEAEDSECAGNEEPANPDPANPDPAMPSDPSMNPSIILFVSTRVAGETEVEAEDPNDTFDDNDQDGICDDVDDDDDGDGICDDDDAHEGPGGGDETTNPNPEESRAELPYDVRLGVGDSFALIDAFEGAAPAITDVEMDGGTWRLSELQSGTTFVVTQADCDHEGNRDTGRDRIFVRWTNPDGSSEIDHLDLRYCDR